MNSSKSGKTYETLVASVLKLGTFTAGSNKHINDIRLSFNDKLIDIEVKNVIDAEYGQKRAEVVDGRLVVPHPLFQTCIEHTDLFDGKIPIYLLRSGMTFPEWELVASDFKDEKYPAPSDSISNYYKEKGNAYIQIRGYGLYHTGEDVCEFGVPYFECPTYLRVRCKRHGKKCALTGKDIPSSVMTSFWISKPPAKSPYSLDDPSTLPTILETMLR